MRKQYIECKARSTARRKCPWAVAIYKAENGYWCFESIEAARTWKRQR